MCYLVNARLEEFVNSCEDGAALHATLLAAAACLPPARPPVPPYCKGVRTSLLHPRSPRLLHQAHSCIHAVLQSAPGTRSSGPAF